MQKNSLKNFQAVFCYFKNNAFIVENKIDFTQSRNLIIAAVILVSALGFNSTGDITFVIAGATVTLSGLAIAAILGIALNAILPGNDYEFGA